MFDIDLIIKQATQKVKPDGGTDLKALVQEEIVQKAREETDRFVAESESDPSVKGKCTHNGSAPEDPYKIHVPGVGLVEVPRLLVRDADGKNVRFKPPVVADLQARYEAETDDLLYSLYIEGLSHRAISRHLIRHGYKPLSHAAVSKRIRKITRKVLGEFRERDLSGVRCPVMYADALYQSIRIGKRSRKVAVILVIGINDQGKRELLEIAVRQNETEAAYVKIFMGLIDRGLVPPAAIVSDNHGAVKSAIARCFPGSVWVHCSVHHRRNVMNALHGAKRAERGEIYGELCAIWEAPTYAEAVRRLEAFVDRYARRFPGMCKCLLKDIDDTFAFYRYPEIPAKLIRSSNEIERLNGHVRARTHKMRIFPSTPAYCELILCYLLERKEEWGEKLIASPESMQNAMEIKSDGIAILDEALDKAMGRAMPSDSPVLALPAPETQHVALLPVTEDTGREPDSETQNQSGQTDETGSKEGGDAPRPSAGELEFAKVPERVAALNSAAFDGDGCFMVQLAMGVQRVPLSPGQPAKVPVYYGTALGVDLSGGRFPLCAVASSKGMDGVAGEMGRLLGLKLEAAPKVVAADAFWEGASASSFAGWDGALRVADWRTALKTVTSLIARGEREEWEDRISQAHECGDAREAAARLKSAIAGLEESFPDAADALRGCAPGIALGAALTGFGVSQKRLSSANLAADALTESINESNRRGPKDPACAAMMVFESLLGKADEWGKCSRAYIRADYARKAATALEDGSLDVTLDVVSVILGGGTPQLTGPTL